mgnify:CR=1 FL=1
MFRYSVHSRRIRYWNFLYRSCPHCYRYCLYQNQSSMRFHYFDCRNLNHPLRQCYQMNSNAHRSYCFLYQTIQSYYSRFQ